MLKDKLPKNSEREEKDDVIEIKLGKHLSMFRENPWIVSTLVLGAVLVLVLALGGIGGAKVKIASESVVTDNVLKFLNSQVDGGVTINSISNEGGYYGLVVDFEGEEVPLQATLDGNYLFTELIPIGSLKDEGQNSGTEDVGSAKRVNVEVGNSPFKGDENAPVTIVEFSDYQCPFCRKFWTETLPLIQKEYIDTGKVRLVYKDLPLENIHPGALPAAEAARCVREQGGDNAYFEMHDKMFTEQNILDGGDPITGPVRGTAQFGATELKQWAKDIGYNIDSCLDSGKYRDDVQKDLAEAAAIGAQGTPYFVINGLPISGAQPYSVFQQIIEGELKN